MPLVDRSKADRRDWYGHVLSTGDEPSLLARRYRSHGHRDELSRHRAAAAIFRETGDELCESWALDSLKQARDAGRD